MMKAVSTILAIVSMAYAAIASEAFNKAMRDWQEHRHDSNSLINQRKQWLFNQCMGQIQQNNGGGMGCGMGCQAQNQMAMMAIAAEIVGIVQWFDNCGNAALQSNRLEYQAKLLRLMQIRQALSNNPQDAQVVNVLGIIIRILQERLNQTAPQGRPWNDGVPRFC